MYFFICWNFLTLFRVADFHKNIDYLILNCVFSLNNGGIYRCEGKLPTENPLKIKVFKLGLSSAQIKLQSGHEKNLKCT